MNGATGRIAVHAATRGADGQADRADQAVFGLEDSDPAKGEATGRKDRAIAIGAEVVHVDVATISVGRAQSRFRCRRWTFSCARKSRVLTHWRAKSR